MSSTDKRAPTARRVHTSSSWPRAPRGHSRSSSNRQEMLCLAVEMFVLAGSRSAEDQQQLSISACTTEHEARPQTVKAQLHHNYLNSRYLEY